MLPDVSCVVAGTCPEGGPTCDWPPHVSPDLHSDQLVFLVNAPNDTSLPSFLRNSTAAERGFADLFFLPFSLFLIV